MKKVFKKENFTRGKPTDTSEEVWIKYKKTGEQKAFYRMNLEKTVISAALITVSITSMMNGIFDILKNPHPFTIIDLYQITGGIIGFLITILIIFLIDRAEELRRLRKKEKEEELNQLIHEQFNLLQEKEMIENEGRGKITSTKEG